MLNKCSSLSEGAAALAMTSYQDWYGTCRTFGTHWYGTRFLSWRYYLKRLCLIHFLPRFIYFITLWCLSFYLISLQAQFFWIAWVLPIGFSISTSIFVLEEKWVQLAASFLTCFPFFLFFFLFPFFFFSSSFLSAFVYIQWGVLELQYHRLV